MRSRRSSRGTEHREAERDERWAISYMDMVTVLMCLFIVLFAMSSLDQKKYELLKYSLSETFGEPADVPSTAPPTTDPQPVKSTLPVSSKLSDKQIAAQEVADLRALKERIDFSLKAKSLAKSVSYNLDERGLTIRLIGSQTFFASNQADLTSMAREVVDTIAPILAATSYQLKVEGHADKQKPSYPYPTNWELSAARATSVLRRLVEHGGVVPTHISSVGFGDAHPIATGNSPEALALNRRVDIVALSSQPERIRALIPSIIGGG